MVRASFPLDAPSAFHQSMPERYRAAFDATEAREHAAIVARRADQPAHLEIWRRLPRGAAIVCVVADDRPGLLSFVSAALFAAEMDVLAAQVYTRPAGESRAAQAIDFLSLRRAAALSVPVLRADLARIKTTLDALVTGVTTVEAVVRKARPVQVAVRGASTKVTFDAAPDAGLVVLTVETFDRPGLLLAITRALFYAGVQIIASDAETRSGRVVDRFTIVEQDGTPIGPARRGLVQMQVLGAIDVLARGELGG